MRVVSLTTFLHCAEGMWRQGQVRDINDFRATELLNAGLVARISTDAPAADETDENDTDETEGSPASEDQSETEASKAAPEPAKKRSRKVTTPVTETK